MLRPQADRPTRRQFLLALGGFPFFWRGPTVVLAGIRFRRIRNGSSKRRYLLIHGDEAAARQVLTDHMKTHRGTAYLVTNETRTVSLMGGQLDPNRMFSREGAEKNLRKLNPEWSAEQLKQALDFLDRERPKLLKALTPPAAGMIVALHNNARGYSMNDEVDMSDRTALNDASHPHEFMLCTDPADFERLTKGEFNVLLQKSGPKDDDGSLSRLAAKRGIRYANIEAALGEREKQERMLAFLESALP